MGKQIKNETLPSREFFTKIPFPLHTFTDARGRTARCKGTDQCPLPENIDLSDGLPKAKCIGGCSGIYPGYIGRNRLNNLFKGWKWSNKFLLNDRQNIKPYVII